MISRENRLLFNLIFYCSAPTVPSLFDAHNFWAGRLSASYSSDNQPGAPCCPCRCLQFSRSARVSQSLNCNHNSAEHLKFSRRLVTNFLHKKFSAHILLFSVSLYSLCCCCGSFRWVGCCCCCCRPVSVTAVSVCKMH